MNNQIKKIMQVIIGAGIGLFIANRGINELIYKAKCRRLQKENSELQEMNKILELHLNKLEKMNELLKDLITKEEVIVDDYDNTTIELDSVLAEDAQRIVDEMSDEEYEEVLAYIREDKLN